MRLREVGRRQVEEPDDIAVVQFLKEFEVTVFRSTIAVSDHNRIPVEAFEMMLEEMKLLREPLSTDIVPLTLLENMEDRRVEVSVIPVTTELEYINAVVVFCIVIEPIWERAIST